MIGARPVTRRWWDEDDVIAALDFGLAMETEDLEGAFRLVHDNYVRDGHMTPQPSGLRVGIFNALPSTRVFVAKDGGRVVGTVTLVLDSPIGLPSDQVYGEELAGLRARGRRLGEATGLSVAPECRGSGAGIAARLYRMLALYAARIARLQELVISVSPRHVRFYGSWFPIRQFGPLRPYPRVNNTRAVGLLGDLVETRALIRQAERGLPLGGFHDFFFAPEACRAVLARLFREDAGGAMTPAQVAHFFAGHGADAASSLVLAAALAAARPEPQALTA
jgi:hypothetical protein